MITRALSPIGLCLAIVACKTGGARPTTGTTTTTETTAATPTAANEAIARRYFDEVWNNYDKSAARTIVAPNVIGHVGNVEIRGIDELLGRIDFIAKTYSEMRFAVEDVIAQRDRVVVRWRQVGRHSGTFMGPMSKGKSINIGGTHVFRFEGGRIAEVWVSSDDLEELRQIGADVPSGV